MQFLRDMTEWLLTIITVSITCFFIKLILPDGSTKKLVAFILSVICILFVIHPLNKIFKNINSDYSDLTINVDYDYVKFAEECRFEYYFTLSKAKLQTEGIKLIQAEFIFSNDNSNKILKKIYIKKNNLVIIENSEHINISYVTKKTLANLFSLKEDDIEIYE